MTFTLDDWVWALSARDNQHCLHSRHFWAQSVVSPNQLLCSRVQFNKMSEESSKSLLQGFESDQCDEDRTYSSAKPASASHNLAPWKWVLLGHGLLLCINLGVLLSYMNRVYLTDKACAVQLSSYCMFCIMNYPWYSPLTILRAYSSGPSVSRLWNSSFQVFYEWIEVQGKTQSKTKYSLGRLDCRYVATHVFSERK